MVNTDKEGLNDSRALGMTQQPIRKCLQDMEVNQEIRKLGAVRVEPRDVGRRLF